MGQYEREDGGRDGTIAARKEAVRLRSVVGAVVAMRQGWRGRQHRGW
jgi:hypothetical protein